VVGVPAGAPAELETSTKPSEALVASAPPPSHTDLRLVSPCTIPPMSSALLVVADSVSRPLPIRMLDDPVVSVVLAERAPIMMFDEPLVMLDPAFSPIPVLDGP